MFLYAYGRGEYYGAGMWYKNKNGDAVLQILSNTSDTDLGRGTVSLYNPSGSNYPEINLYNSAAGNVTDLGVKSSRLSSNTLQLREGRGAGQSLRFRAVLNENALNFFDSSGTQTASYPATGITIPTPTTTEGTISFSSGWSNAQTDDTVLRNSQFIIQNS